ncbi:HAD hydrolase-like protein [Streptomyces sp. S3(2020)]|uniref:HAD family hydrolase n=1 Tax=Streptomyces sp. S3(2020) TaxID=2732044 RepID=UPI003216686F
MAAETGQTNVVTHPIESLPKQVALTRHILFDFDGPICRLFAGYSAADIAQAQVKWLEVHGRDGLLTEQERFSPDPHGVLGTFAKRYPGSDLVIGLEEHLTQQELLAAKYAYPTPFVDVLIQTWVAVGARMAIVTNNSPRAVADYLGGRGLLSCFTPHIYGRVAQELHHLKPHPETLNRALRAMGAAPASSLMIGDSESDYIAARAVGVRFLGYARNPRKRQELLDAKVRPENILDSLEPLLTAVRAQR